MDILAFLVQFFAMVQSYISKRQQRVHIEGSLSCPQDLHFGVPQGSVLGPFLFCLYTTSISQMINTHDVSHHMYADDTQVYIELSQPDTHKSISSLSDCLTDISLWMKSSKLKLNSNKTEFIIIGTKQQRHKLSNHFPVKLLANDISPSDSVLGVIFDSDFSSHKHISNKKYASHAFTTYVISAEFGVTYLYPLLRQYQIL